MIRQQINSIKSPVLRKRYLYLYKNPRVKEILFAVETSDKIFELAEKYKINYKELSREIGLVLLDEMPRAELRKKYPRIYQEIEEEILVVPTPKDFHKELKQHGVHAAISDSTIH